MEFNVSDPLTKLWKEIEDIEALSIAAASPYSQQQLINLALYVIKSTRDYERGINDWYALPTGAQIWLGLKTHFQTARKIWKKWEETQWEKPVSTMQIKLLKKFKA